MKRSLAGLMGVVVLASLSLVVACSSDDTGSSSSSSGGSSSGADASTSSSSGDSGTSSGDSGTQDSGPSATCAAKGATANVATNHGTSPHTLTIPAGDFTTPAAKQYTLSAGGGNMHTHTVDLTAQQLTALKAGTAVTVTSGPGTGGSGGGGGNNANPHEVTFNCTP